jgi:DNA-binding transcriptional LysR family regulator
VGLSTRQLEAFLSVARTLNFTRAAVRLNITQSALSQRVKKLEDHLGATLFIRRPGGVDLTDTGWRILRFCETREHLEAEILDEIAGSREGELSGVVRVAAYSAVMRPVLIPALAPLLRDHPRVQLELINEEVINLPGILKRGEADFVIMDRQLDWPGLTTTLLGVETYVAIESAVHNTRRDVYLDLDPDDRITRMFFEQQEGPAPHYRRSFMSEVYGIVEGAALGLGRAVVSRHLLRGVEGIRILRRYKPWKVRIYMHHFTQPFYTRLHEQVITALVKGCPDRLNSY